MGMFLEANFLVDTSFDYQRLWYHEKQFSEGGSAVYLISLLPTLYALLLHTFNDPRITFLVGHLLNLAWGALLLILLYRLLVSRAGPRGAALACLAVATTPLFNVQLDLLGMDLPMATAGLACLSLLLQQRYYLAALAAALAFLIKVSGGLLAAVGVAWLMAQILADLNASPRVQRHRFLGLGCFWLLLAGEIVILTWKNQLPLGQREYWEPDLGNGWDSLLMVRLWCPDVVILFLVAILLTGVALLIQLAITRPRTLGQWQALVRQLVGGESASLYAWLILIGTTGILSVIYTIPRYLTLPLPFLYLVLTELLWRRAALRTPVALLYSAIILFNLTNLHGRWYPEIAAEGRTGALLERSREYLADHHDNIATVHAILALSEPPPVVAGNPFAQFLSLPRLGYVPSPVAGYALNSFSSPTMRPLIELFHELPTQVVYVRLLNRFNEVAAGTIPEPAADDTILFDSPHPSPLQAFVARVPDSLADVSQQAAWYRQQLEPGQRYLERAQQFLARGDFDIRELYRRALEADPENADARFRLAEMAAQLHDWPEAWANYEILMHAYPQQIEFSLGWARSALHLNRSAEVIEPLRRLLRSAPQRADAQQLLGSALVAQSQPETALPHLQTALRLDPQLSDAHRDLVRAQLALNAAEAAQIALLQWARQAPDDPTRRQILELVQTTDHTSPLRQTLPELAHIWTKLGATEPARQAQQAISASPTSAH
jgi:tetratricopeptide (TPR) repeat protein